MGKIADRFAKKNLKVRDVFIDMEVPLPDLSDLPDDAPVGFSITVPMGCSWTFQLNPDDTKQLHLAFYELMLKSGIEPQPHEIVEIPLDRVDLDPEDKEGGRFFIAVRPDDSELARFSFFL